MIKLALLVAVVAIGAFAVWPRGEKRPAAHPLAEVAFAGPALSGDSVVWGEEYADGSLAVARRRGSGRAQVVARMPAPGGDDRDRSFTGLPGAISATTGMIGFGVDDTHVVSRESDSVTVEGSARLLDTGAGTPVALLGDCRESAYLATDADGARLAVAQTDTACGGRHASRVVVIEGTRTREIHRAAGGTTIGQVRLAGRWIAWSDNDARISVADRTTGAVTTWLTGGELGLSGGIESFDVDEDGSVVVLGPRSRGCHDRCVLLRDAGTGALRTVARNAFSGGVAAAGGRIAFVTFAGNEPADLVLTDRRGRELRRLAGFSARRRPTGDLALTPDRIAWAELDSESEPRPGATGRVRSVAID